MSIGTQKREEPTINRKEECNVRDGLYLCASELWCHLRGNCDLKVSFLEGTEEGGSSSV